MLTDIPILMGSCRSITGLKRLKDDVLCTSMLRSGEARFWEDNVYEIPTCACMYGSPGISDLIAALHLFLHSCPLSAYIVCEHVPLTVPRYRHSPYAKDRSWMNKI